MKRSILLPTGLSLLFSYGVAHAVCDESTVADTHVAKVREESDVEDPELLTEYAQTYCELAEEQKTYAVKIRDLGVKLREKNWRVCRDVDDSWEASENGETVVSGSCKKKHNQKINDLIDTCKDLVGLGHNPHSIRITFDEMSTTNACLQGVATAIEQANDNLLNEPE